MMTTVVGAKRTGGKLRDKARSLPQPLRSYTLAVIGVLLLATALRLYGIARESLWLDEATSLTLARMTLPEIAAWTALDLHPPLYYALLRVWIALGESETVVRGLSALASVLTVLVIYRLGRELFDRPTGLLAALLLALSPFAIWYAQEARMYAWLALLVTTALWLTLVALRGGHWSAWVGYVLAGAAALYTHYYAFFGLGIANLLFLYLALRHRLDKRRVWLWLAAQAGIALLFAPWLPTLLNLALGGGGGWLGASEQKPGLVRLAHTLIFYMLGGTRAALPSLVRRAGYLLYGLALVAGLWPLVGWRRRRSAAHADRTGQDGGGTPPRLPALLSERDAIAFCLVYLALPLGASWLISQIRPMYSERYMLPFLAPFLLLVAWGVRSIPLTVARYGLLLLLAAVMLTGVVVQVRTLDKPDWRGLAAELTAQAQPSDLVLFVPGWHAKPFDYYARGQIDVYADTPVPVPQHSAEALQAVAQAIQGHARVWLVWETGHYTDPDGQVLAYLESELRRVSERPLALVGRVILFVREGA